MALVARPRATPERQSATCLATDSVGDFVSLKSGVAGAFTVEKVDITAAAGMPGVGAIISKSSPTVCVVQLTGQVKGVYTTLTPGAVHYAGSNSKPTATVPLPSVPTPRIYVQPVGIAVEADVLLLQPYPNATVRVL